MKNRFTINRNFYEIEPAIQMNDGNIIACLINSSNIKPNEEFDDYLYNLWF